MNICVYSINTNNYDTVKPVVLSGIPHYLFTDNPDIVANGWTIILIPKTEDCRLQRKIKILGHSKLDKHDVTIYVDASMTLRTNIVQLLRTYKGGLMIGSHKRTCVYAEGLAIKQQNKADPAIVNAQIKEYYENNFPVNFGMWSSGFMIRDKSTKAMCELWHSKLEEHSHRDQLSLPWALYYTQTKPIEVRYEQFASITQHKKKEPLKIFYSTPYDCDVNIGKANNEFISLLPDDAWVCITDADAMFLNSDFGRRVENIINDFGNKYGLIGCLTNRIGGLHQCYKGEFSENMDMKYHYDIANSQLPNEVKDGGVAGFFMLFSKETWKKAGGFKEKSITCDTEFNRSVSKIGGKIGVYQGLYMMHAYRLKEHGKGRVKAQQSISHLR